MTLQEGIEHCESLIQLESRDQWSRLYKALSEWRHPRHAD